MTWWYEIHDADGRLVEIKRLLPTQEHAKAEGEKARRTILDIIPGRTLLVFTGEDVWESE